MGVISIVIGIINQLITGGGTTLWGYPYDLGHHYIFISTSLTISLSLDHCAVIVKFALNLEYTKRKAKAERQCFHSFSDIILLPKIYFWFTYSKKQYIIIPYSIIFPYAGFLKWRSWMVLWNPNLHWMTRGARMTQETSIYWILDMKNNWIIWYHWWLIWDINFINQNHIPSFPHV